MRKCRVLLPTIMGAVSVLLCIWDIHNQLVIQSMGMAWDTGAPIWPYESAAMLFFALNVPPFVIAVRLANIFGLPVPWHYVVVLPAALCWWWIVGVAIDFRASLRFRKTTLAALTLLALLMVWGFVSDVVPWYREFSPVGGAAKVVVFLRTVAPLVWITTLSFLAFLNAKASQSMD